MQFRFRRKVCKIGILKYPLSLSPLGFKINFCYHKIEISYCLCKLPGHQVQRKQRSHWQGLMARIQYARYTFSQHYAPSRSEERTLVDEFEAAVEDFHYYNTLLYFDLRQPVSNSTKGSNIRWWSWSDEEILPCFSIVCSNCEQNNFNDQRLEIDGLPIPKRLCHKHRRKLRKNEMYWSEEKLSEAKRSELKWSEEK